MWPRILGSVERFVMSSSDAQKKVNVSAILKRLKCIQDTMVNIQAELARLVEEVADLSGVPMPRQKQLRNLASLMVDHGTTKDFHREGEQLLSILHLLQEHGPKNSVFIRNTLHVQAKEDPGRISGVGSYMTSLAKLGLAKLEKGTYSITSAGSELLQIQ